MPKNRTGRGRRRPTSNPKVAETTADVDAAAVSQADAPRFHVLLSSPPLRLADVIRSMLPRGTKLLPHRVKGGLDLGFASSPVPVQVRPGKKVDWFEKRDWVTAPALPSDMFAVVAMLMDLSGACHHVVREPPPHGAGSAHNQWRRTLVVNDKLIARAADIGATWKRSGRGGEISAPVAIQESWAKLMESWTRPVFRLIRNPTWRAPNWWHHALFLLMAADQAAAGAGFPRSKQSRSTPADPKFFDDVFDLLLWAKNETRPGRDNDKRQQGRSADADGNSEREVPDPSHVRSKAAHTISNVPAAIASVLPKARTPALGCTLRSLSHHLALLPPAGRARAAWHQPVDTFKLREDVEPLNLLLVPYPFCVPAHSFVPDKSSKAGSDWNWFRLSHREWPGTDHERADEFVEQFLEPVARRAAEKAGPIHALVLPESAIDHDTFRHLCNRIAAPGSNSPWRSIDFVVCGLSKDEKGIEGNYAAAAVFASEIGSETKERMHLINSQQKHHRWRLDGSQIGTYGLGSALSSHEPWWESIELLSRSLNVYVFRKGAAFAPLICEDLARVDPVHDLIRAIGPNLVVALLMDGGQTAARWSGRSAMGLADDPGSSVVTLSSYGLIARANQRLELARRTNSIGLWRDQKGETREIPILPGASGVMLSISSERVQEHTLEGRHDNRMAVRLTLSDQINVVMDHTKFDWEAAGWSTPRSPPWEMPPVAWRGAV